VSHCKELSAVLREVGIVLEPCVKLDERPIRERLQILLQRCPVVSAFVESSVDAVVP
jgi:hypothetical protein